MFHPMGLLMGADPVQTQEVGEESFRQEVTPEDGFGHLFPRGR